MNSRHVSRRSFLFTSTAVAAIGSRALGDGELLRPTTGPGTLPVETLPPIRAITRRPKFHWFGYYDKLQFDPTGRFVLGMEVDFEHRSPKPEDEIALGVIDLRDGDRWREIGRSKAWNWQQGCMLQWLPGATTQVIWNERHDGRFVSRILDVNSGESRVVPAPIYGISPDARWAVFPDFRRLNHTRPGYGYTGVPDPNPDVPAPVDAGIWKVDLQTGETHLLISLADILKIPQPPGAPQTWDATSKHWFNHLLVSPDGQRFIFLHRWRRAGEKIGTFWTRMFTASADGSDLFVLDPSGKTSHFVWRDAASVTMFTWHATHGERFYTFHDRTDKVEVIGPNVMVVNGHNTYLPNPVDPTRWILNDTYPDGLRLQHPYLYDIRSGVRHPLGHFRSPREYTGEVRCDTHPRSSRDGKWVCIDSSHEGGRQMYLIDVRGIVG